MLELERAHDRLGRAAHLLESGAQSGPVDLRPPARAIERVFGGIFDAFEERRPRSDAAREAIASLDEAVTLLTPAAAGDAAVGFAIDYLREVRAALERAAEHLDPLVPRAPPPSPELRASFERPPLHAIDRPSLTPHLRVPVPKPLEVEVVPPRFERPKTFEELERITKQMRETALAAKTAPAKVLEPPPVRPADPPLGFAQDVRPALSEARFLKERVRGCFEEVAMVGVQRAPLLGDPWRGSRVLERRMLASIDAIVAMGPQALVALEDLVLDAPLKDPSRVFAIAMILGCVTGRDTLAMAERVFAAFELDDPQHAAQLGAALKLVPHPSLPLSLRTFLSDPDSGRRALAIDVLAYRGMATQGELARAATDEPDVAAAALPWLALSRHADVRSAIDAAVDGPVPSLRTAARLAMVLSGDFRAVAALRGALDQDEEDAAPAMSLLGVVAGPSDAALLVRNAVDAPTRASVAAIGWAGSKESIPALMALLLHKDEPVVLAAAYALDRITHAGLYEDAIVEAEEIMVPDVPEPDLGDKPALAREVSDPRDLPAEPSTDTLQRPSTDPHRWAAWWKEKSDAFDEKARHRRGSPYTPYISWMELDRWRCTPGERRLLHWELVARTGEYARFDTNDFVPVQEESLAEWEPLARNASGNPGSWNLARRRS
jgi:HEAT repeat protein